MPVPTPPPRSLSVPIPHPWNLEQFRAALERHRGRTLLLEQASLPQGRVALCMTTAAADLIVYDHHVDSQRQLHAIRHQLGPLLLCHHGSDDRQPHLDPALIPTAPLISRYDETDELAADNFASLLVARANATP